MATKCFAFVCIFGSGVGINGFDLHLQKNITDVHSLGQLKTTMGQELCLHRCAQHGSRLGMPCGALLNKTCIALDFVMCYMHLTYYHESELEEHKTT